MPCRITNGGASVLVSWSDFDCADASPIDAGTIPNFGGDLVIAGRLFTSDLQPFGAHLIY